MRRTLRAVVAIAAAMVMACATDAAELFGTSWRAETITGEPVAADVVSTLTFEPDGRVAGQGGCNRYFGTAEIDGDHVTFGPLAATRMYCGGAADEQETRFFRVLESAQRFSLDDQGRLLIHSAGASAPSRMVPEE